MENHFFVRRCEYRMWAPKWWDHVLLKLANKYEDRYERRFMDWCPVETIHFELEALKIVDLLRRAGCVAPGKL